METGRLLEGRSEYGVIVRCLVLERLDTRLGSLLGGNVDSRESWVASGTLLGPLSLGLGSLGLFPRRLC